MAVGAVDWLGATTCERRERGSKMAIKKRRVAITGMGAIAPNGRTAEEFWTACLAGKSVVEPIPSAWREYSNYTSTIWSPLPAVDHAAHNVNRIEAMQLSRAGVLALCVAHQALCGAKLETALDNEKKNTFTVAGIDPLRSGVFCGTGVGGAVALVANEAFHARGGL
jgi:3-oxoacyl-[acyl-carrier-protein] synthase II